jgi:hypothetical protein
MNIALQTDPHGDSASLTPTGPFDLANAKAAVQAEKNAEASLSGSVSVEIDFGQLDRIDGTGAICSPGFSIRLETAECHPSVVEGRDSDAAHLITP